MSGLLGTHGIAEETTFGTFVAPTHWLPMLNERLDLEPRRVQSRAIRGGGPAGLPLGSRTKQVAREGGGDVTYEVLTTEFGLLLKHLMGGGVVTTNPGASAVLHTFELGAARGESLSVYVGVPKTDGTVQAFELPGSKITSGELSIGLDQLAQLAITYDSRNVSKGTEQADGYDDTAKPYTFAQATLKKDGADLAQVRDTRARIERPSATERFFLGNGGLKAEQLANDFAAVTGQITAEFGDPATFYDLYDAETGAELVLEFIGDEIEAGLNEELRLTVPEVRFTGEKPKIEGPDLVMENVPWEAVEPAAGTKPKIEYQTTDGTP